MSHADSQAPTLRGRLTRERLLNATAELVAERGFHAVGIIDIGTAAGVSGAALYRHFRNKHELLAAVFGRVSEQLLDRSHTLVADLSDRSEALKTLVAAHTRFALGNKALLRVFYREAHNLRDEEHRRIRRTERRYSDLWVRVVGDYRPELADEATRTVVHAILGMLNSASYLPGRLHGEASDNYYIRMALAAVDGM